MSLNWNCINSFNRSFFFSSFFVISKLTRSSAEEIALNVLIVMPPIERSFEGANWLTLNRPRSELHNFSIAPLLFWPLYAPVPFPVMTAVFVFLNNIWWGGYVLGRVVGTRGVGFCRENRLKFPAFAMNCFSLPDMLSLHLIGGSRVTTSPHLYAQLLFRRLVEK